jgi:hypothetical protein
MLMAVVGGNDKQDSLIDYVIDGPKYWFHYDDLRSIYRKIMRFDCLTTDQVIG